MSSKPKTTSSGASTVLASLPFLTPPTIYPFTQAVCVPVAVDKVKTEATSYGSSFVPLPVGSGPGPGPSPGSTPTYKLSI